MPFNSFDDRMRETGDHLAMRLRDEIEDGVRRLVALIAESLEAERASAAREARETAESEAARTLVQEVERSRRHAEAWLNREIENVRREVAQQAEARIVEARQTTEHAAQAAGAQAGLATFYAAVRQLLDAAQRMDEAGSLTETLGTLVSAASGQALRVAAILVHPSDGQVWESAGMDEAPRGRTLRLDGGGVIARAVASGQLQFQRGPSATAVPDFVTLTEGVTALAIPLIVSVARSSLFSTPTMVGAGRHRRRPGLRSSSCWPATGLAASSR